MPRQYNLGNNVCKICNYNIFYILAMPNTLYKQHKISIFVNVMRPDVNVMRQAYHIIYYLELNDYKMKQIRFLVLACVVALCSSVCAAQSATGACCGQKKECVAAKKCEKAAVKCEKKCDKAAAKCEKKCSDKCNNKCKSKCEKKCTSKQGKKCTKKCDKK